MSEREKLAEHINRNLCYKGSPPIQKQSPVIVELVMEALDSWIEEQQPQEEEIKVGDKVKLKRKLAEDDGSSTDIVCTVVSPMDSLEAGSIGKVRGEGIKEGELRVEFPEIPSAWLFHVDDLEKAHT